MEIPIPNTFRYLLVYWLPLLIYMLIIFIQSSYPTIDTPGPSHLDKLFHLAAYALLGYLFARAYGASRLQRHMALIVILAIASASLYGVLDELHQSLVPQRRADPWDVGADFLGSLIGVGIYWLKSLKRTLPEP